MIKATRDWAPSEEQGRAFGILEGGRGVVEVIPFTVLLAVFAWLGSSDAALSTVIICCSIINILVGIAAWFILKEPDDDTDPESGQPKRTIGWKHIRIVLKMPIVWLTAMVIMGANTAYWGTYTFTTYASEIFLMSVVAAGALSVGRMWVKPFAAIVSGFIADRIGISRAVFYCMLLTTVSFVLFAFTPGNPAVLPLVLVNVAIAALGIFAVRGIYFALLDEGGVPTAMTGTAAGVASGIGFLPEVYMPLLNGIVLDTYPGLAGYRLLFGFVSIIAAIGFLAALLMIRMNRRAKI
jgi:nitrate/nitrite transporter NarK